MFNINRSTVVTLFAAGAVCAAVAAGCASGPKKNLALNEAARHGDQAQLEQALSSGADVNTIGESNNTPLHEAAMFDNATAAQFLLDHGANPNIGDEDQDTPLHFAAEHGSRNVAQVLVKG